MKERNTTEIAEDVARERLERIASDREDRMLKYARAWELRWAEGRLAASRAPAHRDRLWRVK